MSKIVSIIDIGSNSIKLLVANQFGSLKEDFRGTRIGEGISENNFTIKEEVIQRNIDAIAELFEEANHFNPNLTIITGTSAVRDAHNRDEFCARVKAITGVEVKILSGEEEALIIARGISTDPSIKLYKEFCLFDIGGGSLECIHYKDKKPVFVKSLPLGIVRLTEKYIANPQEPIPEKEIKTIMAIVNESTNDFPIKNLPLIGSGGGFTQAKKILKEKSPLKITDLETLMNKLSSISMSDRIKNYNIPSFRADVMPIALAIIITLANKAGVKEIIHSHFSLRYGLAAQNLDTY